MGLSPRAQGGRDTCSLFAITALAEFECAQKASPPPIRLSEEFLIWAVNRTRKVSKDQAMFYEAVHGLNAFGITSEEMMPYASADNSGRKPSPAAIKDARSRSGRWKAFWIKRWDPKSPLSEPQMLAIKRALAMGTLSLADCVGQNLRKVSNCLRCRHQAECLTATASCS